MQRRGRSGAGDGGGASSQVRVCCEECQLIMSLLLTPYVEFFMLSFTSRRNTDRFWVNLDTQTQVRSATDFHYDFYTNVFKSLNVHSSVLC